MPLLQDILYPNEKDLLAEKYRLFGLLTLIIFVLGGGRAGVAY